MINIMRPMMDNMVYGDTYHFPYPVLNFSHAMINNNLPLIMDTIGNELIASARNTPARGALWRLIKAELNQTDTNNVCGGELLNRLFYLFMLNFASNDGEQMLIRRSTTAAKAAVTMLLNEIITNNRMFQQALSQVSPQTIQNASDGYQLDMTNLPQLVNNFNRFLQSQQNTSVPNHQRNYGTHMQAEQTSQYAQYYTNSGTPVVQPPQTQPPTYKVEVAEYVPEQPSIPLSSPISSMETTGADTVISSIDWIPQRDKQAPSLPSLESDYILYRDGLSCTEVRVDRKQHEGGYGYEVVNTSLLDKVAESTKKLSTISKETITKALTEKVDLPKVLCVNEMDYDGSLSSAIEDMFTLLKASDEKVYTRIVNINRHVNPSDPLTQFFQEFTEVSSLDELNALFSDNGSNKDASVRYWVKYLTKEITKQFNLLFAINTGVNEVESSDVVKNFNSDIAFIKENYSNNVAGLTRDTQLQAFKVFKHVIEHSMSEVNLTIGNDKLTSSTINLAMGLTVTEATSEDLNIAYADILSTFYIVTGEQITLDAIIQSAYKHHTHLYGGKLPVELLVTSDRLVYVFGKTCLTEHAPLVIKPIELTSLPFII